MLKLIINDVTIKNRICIYKILCINYDSNVISYKTNTTANKHLQYIRIVTIINREMLYKAMNIDFVFIQRC